VSDDMTLEGAPTTPSGERRGRDPFAPIEASPRGASLLIAVAVAFALAAAFAGLAPVAGPLAMILALVAHVKGHRYGMPLAYIAGVAMIIGMTFTLYLR